MTSPVEIWAKSAPVSGGAGQSLTEHTHVVLDRLASLKDRQPRLPSLCGSSHLWHWAALACALHDLGKCAAGFQAMLRSGPRFGERHEVLSLALLPALLGEESDDLPWVAAGILCHHRDLQELRKRYDRGDPVMDLPDDCTRLAGFLDHETLALMWLLASDYLLPDAAAHGLLKPAFKWSTATPPDFAQGSAWVPQNMRLCLDSVEKLAPRAIGTSPFAQACRFVRGLVLLSDHAGSAEVPFVRANRLLSRTSTGTVLEKQLGKISLYSHQVELQGIKGSATLIAPTGSGKTESALLWVSNQYEQNDGFPPFFYVLPYQASLNAMRARLGRLFGQKSVVLQHSRATQALYRQLMDRGYSPGQALKTAVRERSLSKLHVSPIRLLTPYQLLRGAYQLRGHAALWTDAASGIFVLDELHAYETTRLGLILETLNHLTRDLGAQVLVMSATMPSLLRAAFNQAVGGTPVVTASPETYERFRRHRLHLLEGDLLDEAVLGRISEAAGKGQSVLVVANTVARAQEIWSRVRRREGLAQHVRLLHGRFCGRDRFKKEQALAAAVATDRPMDQRTPIVLVATQVVEVSLDIDFDLLFSDPAPLEALLQRFGRVNRKRRVPLADVFVTNQLGAGRSIYSLDLVTAALECLTPVAGQAIDEAQVQGWLDVIYSGRLGDIWAEEVQRARHDFRRDVLNALTAFDSSPELEKRFDELFDGSEVLPAILEVEYRRLQENAPLLAPSLLVQVTAGQMTALRRHGLLRSMEDGVHLAEVPYNEDVGLELSSMAAESL
jgi:CRISPR-associated endonuclease/helicase Cas3